ncbi:aldo/keto reductase [Dactylosporangium sp. NBC_01737]|uniref:aldo/keto reductase n=1 Tax=Dactylosporangium sp. NBC_01737 TaxID=2975959 RepID=UPI002E125753|nr:aldo/keto reductase [Dactylosporangium sp. NBC_01737]
MRTRQVGRWQVGAVGLGAMPLPVEGRPDEARAVATLRAAVDAGVTLIDTADSYHWHAGEAGHNERLIAKALTGVDGVLVATKGGRGRPGDGTWTVDAHPDHLIRACEASLRRLGTDRIALYQLHKPDPAVPWADSVGALRMTPPRTRSGGRIRPQPPTGDGGSRPARRTRSRTCTTGKKPATTSSHSSTPGHPAPTDRRSPQNVPDSGQWDQWVVGASVGR